LISFSISLHSAYEEFQKKLFYESDFYAFYVMNIYGIIPCYNEAGSLAKSFPIINELLKATSHTLHGLLFVNDGSLDATKSALENLRKQLPIPLKVQNSLLNLTANYGKAGAVFAGMEHLKNTGKINDNDLLLLLDGDIIEPISPAIISDIQTLFLQNTDLQMVII
jgi:glycosyltransferase involved in cell wall biosynthesis